MPRATTLKWVRITKRNPCPVCGKSDWCLISRDRESAICARIENNKPAGNNGAGWTHTLDNATPLPPVKSKPDTKQNLRRAAWMLKIIKKTTGENVSRETAPDAAQTAPELQEVVAKLVHYGKPPITEKRVVMQHPGGRPRKEGEVHRATRWRRAKQGALL